MFEFFNELLYLLKNVFRFDISLLVKRWLSNKLKMLFSYDIVRFKDGTKTIHYFATKIKFFNIM